MMVPANTVGEGGSVSYCPICRRWGDHELNLERVLLAMRDGDLGSEK